MGFIRAQVRRGRAKAGASANGGRRRRRNRWLAAPAPQVAQKLGQMGELNFWARLRSSVAAGRELGGQRHLAELLGIGPVVAGQQRPHQPLIQGPCTGCGA